MPIHFTSKLHNFYIFYFTEAHISAVVVLETIYGSDIAVVRLTSVNVEDTPCSPELSMLRTITINVHTYIYIYIYIYIFDRARLSNGSHLRGLVRLCGTSRSTGYVSKRSDPDPEPNKNNLSRLWVGHGATRGRLRAVHSGGGVCRIQTDSATCVRCSGKTWRV